MFYPWCSMGQFGYGRADLCHKIYCPDVISQGGEHYLSRLLLACHQRRQFSHAALSMSNAQKRSGKGGQLICLKITAVLKRLVFILHLRTGETELNSKNRHSVSPTANQTWIVKEQNKLAEGAVISRRRYCVKPLLQQRPRCVSAACPQFPAWLPLCLLAPVWASRHFGNAQPGGL